MLELFHDLMDYTWYSIVIEIMVIQCHEDHPKKNKHPLLTELEMAGNSSGL